MKKRELLALQSDVAEGRVTVELGDGDTYDQISGCVVRFGCDVNSDWWHAVSLESLVKLYLAAKEV